MKTINKYKLFIEELHFIFSTLEKCEKVKCLDYCSISLLRKQETKTMHYANRIAGEIKEELIGDGKEAEFKGRLKTAYWELGCLYSSYYFPTFETPNLSMIEKLSAIYGNEAADVLEVINTISQWANDMVQDVCSMLDEVCKFVGYTPEPQQGEMPKELNTPEAKMYFAKAIELGLMDNNNNWLKGLQMLACFAREMSLKLKLGKGERISWKPFETLFNVPVRKLRLNYNDIQKTGQAPKEEYLIDKVFE